MQSRIIYLLLTYIDCSNSFFQQFGSLFKFDIQNFRISIDMDVCGFALTFRVCSVVNWIDDVL